MAKKQSKAFADAVMSGNLEEVEKLLKKGADPDAVSDSGDTALATAAWYDQSDMAELLLRYQANPNAEKGRALWNAARTTASTDGDMIELLVKAGANINAFFNFTGSELKGDALMTAVYFGYAKKAWKLLELGAGLDAKNDDGVTALTLAAGMGFRKLGKALLDKGAKFPEEHEFYRDFEKRIRAGDCLHDNRSDTAYCMGFMEEGKSPHSTGNPDLTQVYVGETFPGCANPPVHLLDIDLSRLDGLPADIRKIGRLNVVYQNCNDCDGEDYVIFQIEKDGRVRPTYPAPEDLEEPSCDAESYDASPEITYLEAVQTEERNYCRSGIEIGGEPHWQQNPEYVDCDQCETSAFYLGRIYQFSTPPGAEGAGNMLYLFVCPDCRTLSVVRQMS